MRSFYDFDSKLKKLKGPFKRYTSLSDLPFDAFQCKPSFNVDERIKHFEELIRRQLTSKFAVPQLARSDYGQLINTDEALEGIPECYRHTRPIKSVLKLGLNISADYAVTGDLFAMRAGAIIAIYNLARKRGQQVQFDVCYGNYGRPDDKYSKDALHTRTQVMTPTVDLVKIVMSDRFWSAMIDHVNRATFGVSAIYRLWRLHEDYPELKGEFDFCLDRIESNDPDVEYKRIFEQIKNLI